MIRSSFTAFLVYALTWAVSPALAADATDWSQDSKSAMRLIAGNNSHSDVLAAGIEIHLQPGWHTYWRYPGDAGVPPRFDFSGSSNLKSVKILYPAPQVHEEEGGHILGYEDHVILPLQIIPKEAGKPVQLDLKLDYAVCEKVCIPAEGTATLSLNYADSAQASLLNAAQARVPVSKSATDLGLTLQRSATGTKPRITVDLPASAPKGLRLIVEGPSPEWALPIPEQVQNSPAGHRQFAFNLDGLPPGVDPKGHFDLTFTVIEGERAFEVKKRLD